MGRILEVLQRHALFEGLPLEDLSSLVLECRIRTPIQGDRIFSAGDDATAFYIVATGGVKLSRVTPDGKEHVVEVFRPGESIALMPVMDGGRYPATAHALVDSSVILVPRAAFGRLLASRPEMGPRAAREVGEKLRRMRARVEEIATRSVPARVAAHVLRLAEASPAGARAGTVVDLGAGREVVAGVLGTVREVLARTLAGMARDGVIAVRGRRIEILDAVRLRSLAGE